MTSAEIRRRALRAAAAVTFGVVMMGCGAQVESDPDPQAVEAENGGTGEVAGRVHYPRQDATVNGDDGATTATAGGGQGTTATAGGSVASGGGAGGAGGGAAQIDCHAQAGQDWDAYTACCDANNWDWNAGCEAWGPPMPPTMGWDAKAVA